MTVDRNAWHRVEAFLNTNLFDGFTSDDLFIMNFIKKGWGQDIAALSNMAEAVYLRYQAGTIDQENACTLMRQIVQRATHKTVSPYRSKIESVNNLGAYGYYLEHMNITIGHAYAVGATEFSDLNLRISEHLHHQSIIQKNAHARLIPHIKMRWSADQSAILKSLWLCDQNHQSDFHREPTDRWLDHMASEMTHPETGLFETEAMRVKSYSRQPRGCSHSYMVHYMSSFAPEVASKQWELFKANMYESSIGFCGFREYLPAYDGKWTPDSGPIIGGIGIAATGLGLKAAYSLGDKATHAKLKGSIDRVLSVFQATNNIPGVGLLTSIGTDLLASAIYSNATPAVTAPKR
jgi:hypothetical protein